MTIMFQGKQNITTADIFLMKDIKFFNRQSDITLSKHILEVSVIFWGDDYRTGK
jgi:hypothetical protein